MSRRAARRRGGDRVDDLIRLLDRNRIGKTVSVDVLRLGKLRSFAVTPTERTAPTAP